MEREKIKHREKYDPLRVMGGTLVKWAPRVFPNRAQEINALPLTALYPVLAPVYPDLKI